MPSSKTLSSSMSKKTHHAFETTSVDECIRFDFCLVFDGFTPIHYAAYRGFYHGLKLLLDRGANPNVTTHANCTPLFYAAQQGHKDCVELLLKRM